MMMMMITVKMPNNLALLSCVYTMQPVVQPAVQPVVQPALEQKLLNIHYLCQATTLYKSVNGTPSQSITRSVTDSVRGLPPKLSNSVK